MPETLHHSFLPGFFIHFLASQVILWYPLHLAITHIHKAPCSRVAAISVLSTTDMPVGQLIAVYDSHSLNIQHYTFMSRNSLNAALVALIVQPQQVLASKKLQVQNIDLIWYSEQVPKNAHSTYA